MRRVLAGFVVVICLAAATNAAHDEPSRAQRLSSDLITGYQPCCDALPHDMTAESTLHLPADRAFPNDRYCRFDNAGRGTIRLKAIDGDLAIAARAKGIVGCDGQMLCTILGSRLTTGDCAGGGAQGCTVLDTLTWNLQIGGVPATCCVVDRGNCRINTTLNTGFADPVHGDHALVAGRNTALQLTNGLGLQRVTPISGDFPAGPAFVAGLLVK